MLYFDDEDEVIGVRARRNVTKTFATCHYWFATVQYVVDSITKCLAVMAVTRNGVIVS